MLTIQNIEPFKLTSWKIIRKQIVHVPFLKKCKKVDYLTISVNTTATFKSRVLLSDATVKFLTNFDTINNFFLSKIGCIHFTSDSLNTD